MNKKKSVESHPASLPKARRLRSPSEFQKIYQNKQFGNTDLHSFNVLARDSQPSRLGVTVSRKVSKRAVQRNKIRRRIREFYRLHQNQLLAADVVITAKVGCATASPDNQRDSLNQLWAKLLKWQRWNIATQNSDSTEKDPR